MLPACTGRARKTRHGSCGGGGAESGEEEKMSNGRGRDFARHDDSKLSAIGQLCRTHFASPSRHLRQSILQSRVVNPISARLLRFVGVCVCLKTTCFSSETFWKYTLALGRIARRIHFSSARDSIFHVSPFSSLCFSLPFSLNSYVNRVVLNVEQNERRGRLGGRQVLERGLNAFLRCDERTNQQR